MLAALLSLGLITGCSVRWHLAPCSLQLESRHPASCLWHSKSGYLVISFFLRPLHLDYCAVAPFCPGIQLAARSSWSLGIRLRVSHTWSLGIRPCTLLCLGPGILAGALLHYSAGHLGHQSSFLLSPFCLSDCRWFPHVLTSCPSPLAVDVWASCVMRWALTVLGPGCSAGSRQVLLYLGLSIGLFVCVSPFP